MPSYASLHTQSAYTKMWGEEVLKRAKLFNQTGLDLNSGSTTYRIPANRSPS